MPSAEQRHVAKGLLDLLERDLQVPTLGEKRREEILTQLKVLGREASNVASLYQGSGIQILGLYGFGDQPSSVSREALRCLANALLLLPMTRQSFIKEGLDRKAADALREAEDDDEFLLSRILFLLTYEPSIDLGALILEHGLAENVVAHISRHAWSHAKGTATPASRPSSAAALSETLKLLFNITSVKPDQISRFTPAVHHLLSILSQSDISTPPLQPPISLVMNALANLDLTSDVVRTEDLGRSEVDQMIKILELSLLAYKPAELDTLAIPLLTVLRKVNDVAGDEVKAEMKERLLPKDSERDLPLGQSSSLASQLLRLTTGAGLTNLPEAISSLLFEISDKDANEFVKNVGYGYAAGYLMSHKIPVPESAQQSQTAGDVRDPFAVNPVTGQRLDKEPEDPLPQMTKEEKEREAERLFVLFERLKATGVVDAKNPVQLAMEEGRFEEVSDSESSD